MQDVFSHLDSDLRPSRVLILGRKGFISKHLSSELLNNGVVVEAVGRPTIDLTEPSSVTTLITLLRETDAVVITAALTPDKGRDFRTLMKNLRMAEHLCEVFDRRHCAHVVYLSSDAVYAGDQNPLDESSNRQPVDLYALMHTSREMMLGSVLAANRIPYCILRPCAVYGPGDTHNSYGPNRFIRSAVDEGRIAILGEGEETRDHVYVKDLVRAIWLVLKHRAAGSLNVASGCAVSFMAVAQLVARTVEREVRIESLPRTSPATHRHFDHCTFDSALPRFAFTPLEKGIAETVSVI